MVWLPTAVHAGIFNGVAISLGQCDSYSPELLTAVIPFARGPA